MMVEGNGYEVIDLGVDVKAEKFEASPDQTASGSLCLHVCLADHHHDSHGKD